MFAPPLYIVRNYPLKYLIDNEFKLQDNKDDEFFYIKQQDNQLFRQIRLVTGDKNKFNKWIVFVDCKGGQSYESELAELVNNGLTFGSQHFNICDRSASMTRFGTLSFIDDTIEKEMDKRVVMNAKEGKKVLSKWYAYKGLLLSSCHCIENWYPKIVIVPDYFRTIPDQKIKYVYDKNIHFVDKEGKERDWVQKEIAETVRSIDINVFDGSGVHHPYFTNYIQNILLSSTKPTSILWRLPFIKGVTHEIDYVKFFAERGIKYITDIWGVQHSVAADSEPMIIMCESMYKGYKYFKRHGDVRDWDYYWESFKQYNHCVGIAKWNFSVDEEPIYTRASYQELQDLNLTYDDFSTLANDSISWVTKIIDDDKFYTYCFLGMFADNHDGLNAYTKAILKNPEMLKEYTVRNYLITLMDKYIDEMKCGKLWLKACFKFLTPDLIMMLEHIAGLEPKGCLETDEFYSFNKNGVLKGEMLIERNPHISKSEHVILKATENELLKTYCSHLDNVCMINGKSITPQRLNGGDYD